MHRTTDKVAACLVPIMPTHSLIPYPSLSQRLSEQGTTTLAVSIGTDGAPASVTVNHASGGRHLDDAAVSYIKTHYRWQPPPEDCKPEATQAKIIVNWRLDPPIYDVAMTMTMLEADYPPGAVERSEAGDTTLDLAFDETRPCEGEGRVVSSSNYP